jgi:hypothetical protein
MTNEIIRKLAYEGALLALRAKNNPNLPLRLRKEAYHSLIYYRQIMSGLSQGGCHG